MADNWMKMISCVIQLQSVLAVAASILSCCCSQQQAAVKSRWQGESWQHATCAAPSRKGRQTHVVLRLCEGLAVNHSTLAAHDAGVSAGGGAVACTMRRRDIISWGDKMQLEKNLKDKLAEECGRSQASKYVTAAWLAHVNQDVGQHTSRASAAGRANASAAGVAQATAGLVDSVDIARVAGAGASAGAGAV